MISVLSHKCSPSIRALVLLPFLLAATNPTTAAPARRATPPTRTATVHAIESRADFPVMRETIRYPAMDWENDRTVERTIHLEDRAALNAPTIVSVLAPANASVRARVPDQTFSSDLGNISNRADFGGFTPEQARRLFENAFVVTSGVEPQMFQIYERNVYWNIPNFVSTDIFLHTWSDLFGYSLRQVEHRIVFGWVKKLVAALRRESHRISVSSRSAAVRDAALRNAAYFAVAEVLLTRTTRDLPRPLRAGTERTIAAIREAAGRIDGPFGDKIALAEFKPRGHYTTSEDARNFFRAMTWIGAVPISVTAKYDSTALLQAALILGALENAKVDGIPAKEIWSRIHDLTALFSGPANTLTPIDVARVMREIGAPSHDPDALANDTVLERLRIRLLSLPPARIRSAEDEGESISRITFLGRRYILDGEILQRLVKWPDRPLAGGLDLAAAVGSSLAAAELTRAGEDVRFPWLATHQDEVRQLVRSLPTSQWTSNLYWGTLWTVAALLEDRVTDSGLPRFMRGPGWAAKRLNTGLGGWAELRHNTLLYAEAFASEGGGDDYKVNLPIGYIEPDLAFFTRMTWLAGKLRGDLSASGALTSRMDEKISLFQSLCETATAIVRKELAFEPLDDREARFVHFIGTAFGEITTGCLLNDSWKEDYDRQAQWNSLPEGSRNQAVIADIGRGGELVREVGIGPAHEIFVIVPSTRGPRLTRGAVYQYYEFDAPAEDRMIDEEWKIRLVGDSKPTIPAWSRVYRSFDLKPGPIGLEGREAVDWLEYIFVPD